MARTLSGPTLLPDGTIRDATLTLHDGKIASLHAGLEPGTDLVTRGVIAPGFVDLQVNGGFGCDFTQDPSSICLVSERLPRTGVTAYLPTCVTSPIEGYAGWLESAAEAAAASYGAQVAGFHLEGVYFSPHRTGAHNPALMRPIDVHEIVTRYANHPMVRIVTLAPELPHALDAIAALVHCGVIVSAGHSNATWDEAQRAIEAGIGWGTHLFNAMHELRHREPGLPLALLLSQVPVGLIADGVHLHPAIIQLALRLKGAAGITLVTDAMAAMGNPPGVYNLGGFDVHVDEHAARLATGTLAGSILTMDAAVRYLVDQCGCSIADALIMASRTPADLLRLHNKGRLVVGADADIVVLDESLHVAATLVAGEVVHQA